MALKGHPLNWILMKARSKREQAARRRREAALEAFIAERRPGFAALGEEEIERRSAETLARVDQHEVMRAAQTLREQWKSNATPARPVSLAKV